MVTTLTVNPCIDKTLSVEKFDIYKMNRAEVISKDVSGKGINISLALNGLKRETFCVGFDFIAGEEEIKPALERIGIQSDFYSMEKPLRACMKIFDRSIKHSIEINEFGAEVSASDGEEVIKKLIDAAEKSSFVALSGSLPKGLSEDFYYECAKAVKARAPHCKIMVDAEKDVLLKALKASPYFIKPNCYEFEETFGAHAKDTDELAAIAKDVVKEYGLKFICVSLGKDGAVITDGKESFYANAFPVDVKSIQGAGDAMVAGIICAIEDGMSLEKTLLYGAAASAASVIREGTKLCVKEDFDRFLSRGTDIFRIGG